MRLHPALLCSSVACHPALRPPEVGAHAKDGVALADSPALAHEAAALTPGRATTVGDLFDGAPLSWQAAPDPSALLAATQAANGEGSADAVPLSVLSFNVALLDANVFWVVPYAETPWLVERRGEIPDLVLSQGYDVVLVQEAWKRQDLRRFEIVARRLGYLVHEGPRGSYNDGLLTFVKQDRLVPGAAVEGGASPYVDRDPLEFFPGPKIKRGYTWLSVELQGVGRVHLFNTHLLAWPANWDVRMREARQLGIAVADRAGETDLAIVGGDLNGGSYYRADTWTRPDGSAEAGWWGNTLAYGLLQHYGGLEDLVIMGRTAEDALLDVTLGDTVPNLPGRALAEPMGDRAWCASSFGRNFTATDCTPLYFQQYAGTEFPARMDHLLVRDPNDRVRVESSELVFTEDVRFADLPPMPPSDHLGVAAHLRVKPGI